MSEFYSHNLTLKGFFHENTFSSFMGSRHKRVVKLIEIQVSENYIITKKNNFHTPDFFPVHFKCLSQNEKICNLDEEF